MNIRDFFIEKPVEFFKTQLILKDKFIRWFLFLAIVLCLVVVGMLVFRLRPAAFVVPIEYTSGIGFTRLGDWKLIYSYGLFSLLVTIGNIALAVTSFDKSRISSFFLLISAILINTLTIVVLSTLLGQLG
ncbi:MAG: hypothetical protein WDZ42_01775 [Candidatus Saccharimonadales bacterium]